MDLRLLDYFLRVAECGSLNRAAVELQMTQPALSRHITRLEYDLGHPLFVRHRGGVQLTEVGLRLVDPAKALLNQASLLREDIDNEPSGQVTMAITSSMFQMVAIPAIEEMRSAAPRVLVRVLETHNDALREHMRRGIVDFGILAVEPRFVGEFDVIETVDDALVLVRPPGAAAMNPIASVADLAALPLISPARPNLFRMTVEQALRREKLPVKVSIEGETLGFTLEMVKRGVGQAVLPACALFGLPGLERFPVGRLEGLSIQWGLAVNRRRRHLPVVRRLLRILQGVLKRRIEDGSWPMRDAR